MPKVINPGPLVTQEREYDRALRADILNPLRDRVNTRLAAGVDARRWREVVDGEFEQWIDENPDAGVEVADKMLKQIEARHKATAAKKFSRSLGVDVNPLMSDTTIEPVMKEALRNNVDLIKSIPTTAHDRVNEEFYKVFEEHGLDQEKFASMLKHEFDVMGNRIKLITRDQNNKLIGALNQARNQQLGITEYIWQTAGDERVRSEHRVLDGTRHKWDNPPATGHPGFAIQCRCISLAVF